MSTHEIIALLLAFLTIAIATAIALYFEKRDVNYPPPIEVEACKSLS